MELVERRFDELSRLQYRVFTCALGGKHNPTALVLRFSGVYGVGSAGNGDADFMRVVTRAATSAWHCHAAVFDLRELAYEWGNSIWGVFGRGFEQSGVEGLPCALVVSDLCRGGFSTCQGLVPPMFDDLESAVGFVGEPARAELDRMFAELDGERLTKRWRLLRPGYVSCAEIGGSRNAENRERSEGRHGALDRSRKQALPVLA